MVTAMTSPDMVPAMTRAAAIVTDEGGMTCHAAIVARELGIPCIVGASDATELLKEGILVTVDGSMGVVYEGVTAPKKDDEKASRDRRGRTPHRSPAPRSMSTWASRRRPRNISKLPVSGRRTDAHRVPVHLLHPGAPLRADREGRIEVPGGQAGRRHRHGGQGVLSPPGDPADLRLQDQRVPGHGRAGRSSSPTRRTP